MIPKTCYVLGNSPSLPVERLPELRAQFTIGINRITNSGFCPTVIFWSDKTVYKDIGADIDRSGALLVTGASVKSKAFHVALPFETTAGDKRDPAKMYIKGNTGCAAARWAMALGCERVYLLGMNAAYQDGQTNFYGNNRYHNKSTLGVLSKQLDLLKADYPDQMIEANDPALWDLSESVNQDALRNYLRDLLRSKGLEFDNPPNA